MVAHGELEEVIPGRVTFDADGEIVDKTNVWLRYSYKVVTGTLGQLLVKMLKDLMDVARR